MLLCSATTVLLALVTTIVLLPNFVDHIDSCGSKLTIVSFNASSSAFNPSARELIKSSKTVVISVVACSSELKAIYLSASSIITRLSMTVIGTSTFNFKQSVRREKMDDF